MQDVFRVVTCSEGSRADIYKVNGLILLLCKRQLLYGVIYETVGLLVVLLLSKSIATEKSGLGLLLLCTSHDAMTLIDDLSHLQ